MKKEIFKFQRPIMTNNKSEPILVYNKDRSILNQLVVSKRIMKILFPGGSVKEYWLCVKHKDGILEPIVWVEEQEW